MSWSDEYARLSPLATEALLSVLARTPTRWIRCRALMRAARTTHTSTRGKRLYRGPHGQSGRLYRMLEAWLEEAQMNTGLMGCTPFEVPTLQVDFAEHITGPD